MCQAIWGDSEVSWEMQPTINSAGGILCLWCENSFRLQRKVIGNGFIFLEGDLIREAQQINIIAIYSPCDIHGKRSLWEAVKHLKEAAAGGLWCILGDLNAIRDLEERFGSSQRSISDSSIIEFNNRIHELELLEVPWLGRKFTWIIPNGASRSRLDRCLVSPEWLNRWPASVQMTLARNFSDHCPILLRSKIVDWGPQPFIVLDCWLSDVSFKKVVHQCWNSQLQPGWGGFVLKEKFKNLKMRVKRWNKEEYGDTFNKFKMIESDLNKLEEISSHRQLSSQEDIKRKNLQEALWAVANAHESLLRQKARTRWIKESDCNSRYFHLLMNAHRRNNYIKGVRIDGAWCDEPQKVKEEVRNFFFQRFQEADPSRPTLDGIPFQTINQHHSNILVAPFQEEEIKEQSGTVGVIQAPDRMVSISIS
ncbi:hypothetical protein GmHk_13G036474 [Glycine max]|nr:hypothetical protein GmHk_13G036474 [Glycine max]